MKIQYFLELGLVTGVKGYQNLSRQDGSVFKFRVYGNENKRSN
ncbi:MAG: hypothetical protein QXU18_12365 [Thermoplasmatales archaeon]